MFVEFDSSALQEWNSLSIEQQQQRIANYDVQIAVDVEIKIERNQKIVEEHKYYHVTSDMRLINDMLISSINNEEVVFSIDMYNKSNLIPVKLNEEKTIEIGFSPYNFTLKIKVCDMKYGRIVEL